MVARRLARCCCELWLTALTTLFQRAPRHAGGRSSGDGKAAVALPPHAQARAHARDWLRLVGLQRARKGDVGKEEASGAGQVKRRATASRLPSVTVPLSVFTPAGIRLASEIGLQDDVVAAARAIQDQMVQREQVRGGMGGDKGDDAPCPRLMICEGRCASLSA